MELKHLTDAELLVRLRSLSAQERECVADVVEHLAELERRDTIADTGCDSLFTYCVRVLHYSEAAAYSRIRAARASQTDARVIEGLRSGALHLDAVMRLAPHLTPQNSERLLDLASGATSREVQTLVAGLAATPPPERDVIRIVSAPEPMSSSLDVIPPPSRVRLTFTADEDFLRMVESLRSLRRHKYPEGRLEDLLKESIAMWLAKLTPKARLIPTRQTPALRPRSRRIPAALKAAVWERDRGRCAFIGPDGQRCDSKDFLQYDHIVPWSLGGPTTSDNLRLLCRPHNLRLARKTFGPRKRGLVRLNTPAHAPHDQPASPKNARDGV